MYYCLGKKITESSKSGVIVATRSQNTFQFPFNIESVCIREIFAAYCCIRLFQIYSETVADIAMDFECDNKFC